MVGLDGLDGRRFRTRICADIVAVAVSTRLPLVQDIGCDDDVWWRKSDIALYCDSSSRRPIDMIRLDLMDPLVGRSVGDCSAHRNFGKSLAKSMARACATSVSLRRSATPFCCGESYTIYASLIRPQLADARTRMLTSKVCLVLLECFVGETDIVGVTTQTGGLGQPPEVGMDNLGIASGNSHIP